MLRKSAISLGWAVGWAGLLVVAACSTDTPRSTTGPNALPAGPLFNHVTGHCDAELAKAIGSDQKIFSQSVRQVLADKLKALKTACGTGSEVALGFDYVTYVLADGNRGASTVPQQTQVAAHINSLTTYVGLGSAGLNPLALLPGGGVCVIPLTGGQCTTQTFIQATVIQGNIGPLDTPPLAAPTADDFPSHIVSMFRDATVGCLPTSLPLQTNYCINLSYFPAAAGFTPPLQFAMCTSDEDPPFLDVTNPLVTLGHKKNSNGKVEALARWPSPTTAAPLACDHGPPPAIATGTLQGTMQSFLASVKNVFMPKPLYAINGGLGITDDFGGGFSPLGGVNLLVFYDDFSTDVIGAQPAIQSGDVGSWAINVQGSASISVQTGLGDLADTVVVLNQSNGACENCPVLSLVGTLANGSGGTVPADVGTYVVKTTTLQNKPSTKNAPFILQSALGAEIARLVYVTENSNRVLKFSTNGAAPLTFTIGGQTATWNVGVHQDFEFTVNLDANTITLTVNGAATSITNVPFADVDFAKAGWIFGGIDAGIVAVSKLSVTRSVDP